MAETSTLFTVQDYDLAATLTSGQAFRWQWLAGAWEGVVARHWVRLRQHADGIEAMVAEPVETWDWLAHYLQVQVDIAAVLAAFPKDPQMATAVAACRGLRLLRQDPWECLASFILSSTKQIVQIQQIVRLVCEQYGQPVKVPPQAPPSFAFPNPERIASLSEAELRACKMGFRAPYLRGTAQMVANGTVDLHALSHLSCAAARHELLRFPGVGRKIADCVLLFAYGFQEAFPVDVWVMKAMQQLYFPKRKVRPDRLVRFTEQYFAPFNGYAQQYLFHYMRLHASKVEQAKRIKSQS